MTDSLIHKLRYILFVTFLFCSPLPVFAQGSVEILRYSTEGDTVTLKVQVTDDEGEAIPGLTRDDFIVQTTDDQGKFVPLNSDDLNFLLPTQSQPDPVYLVILLDLSGSMNNDDLSGNRKLTSAIDGIKEFITQIKSRNIPFHLSIVPFGYIPLDSGCSISGIDLSANENVIDSNFRDINSSDLITQLDQLANKKDEEICAATNIYQPLTSAVNYLVNRFPADLSANKKQTEIIKLAVILLSDGYDVFEERSNEEKRFQELVNTLKNNPQVKVHTMGYGEKLKELRDRINQEEPGFCPLDDTELTVDNVREFCQYPGGEDINQYIVDEPRLTEIAKLTNGISKFPGNPQEVVETFINILPTFKEYEIQYQQPGADRAEVYTTTVTVNSPERQVNGTAKEKIRLDNISFKSISRQQRIVLFIVIVLISAGVIQFFLKDSRH